MLPSQPCSGSCCSTRHSLSKLLARRHDQDLIDAAVKILGMNWEWGMIRSTYLAGDSYDMLKRSQGGIVGIRLGYEVKIGLSEIDSGHEYE